MTTRPQSVETRGAAAGDPVEESQTPLEEPTLPPAPSGRPFLARLWTALGKEIHDINVRMLIANLVVILLPNSYFSYSRTAIYRLAGLQIGARSRILGRIEFTGSARAQERLHIGTDTIINAHFFVDLNGDVHIGNWVSIGHHVTLITSDHLQGPAYCRAGLLRPAPISINDGSWISAGCTLLPGAIVGKSTIIAACSLVAGNVPANRVAGGVPARALKNLPEVP